MTFGAYTGINFAYVCYALLCTERLIICNYYQIFNVNNFPRKWSQSRRFNERTASEVLDAKGALNVNIIPHLIIIDLLRYIGW